MRPLLRKACLLLALVLSANSFQNSHHVNSISCVTKYREERRKNAGSRSVTNSSQRRVVSGINNRSKDTTAVLLSNDFYNGKSDNEYNDDAFGFVFLGGFLITQDPIFAGIFLLLSARNGKLPATNSVPAAVAGCTLIVNLIIPKDSMYELLPFIEMGEPSLPLDSSLIEIGICTVSMIYRLILFPSNQKENP
jgi:hypothetical protein